MAGRDFSGRLALNDIGLFFGALLNTNTIIKDVVDVGRVGSSTDLADVEVTVILIARCITTDVTVAINWCNQLPRLTIHIAVEGANEHAYDHSRED